MRAALILLALALCGCANTRPDTGALLPSSATFPGASYVTILAATTRWRDESPAMFSGERMPPRRVAHASVTVSVPPVHIAGQIEWPDAVPGNSATNFTTVARAYISEAEFRVAIDSALASRAGRQRDVLLFIHGYNTHFDEAVYRLAQFVHDSRYDGVPVLFSIASRGSFWDYLYDRDSASAARDALEATIRVLCADPKIGRINILAHSVGNLLMMEMFRQAAIRGDSTFGGRIGDIVMAAPDIDVDLFRTQLDALGNRMPGPTVMFVSSDDSALGLSQTISGNEPRVGVYANAAEFTGAGITVVDISAISTGAIGHDKIFASEGLARLVGSGLARGDRFDTAGRDDGDRWPGRLTSLGNAVGNTINAVLGVIFVSPGR